MSGKPIYINNVTHIPAIWANAISDLVYDVFEQATTKEAAKQSLGLGTLSAQNNDAVVIQGGEINNTTIGGLVPKTALFSSARLTELTPSLPGSIITKHYFDTTLSSTFATLNLQDLSRQASNAVNITGGYGIFDTLRARGAPAHALDVVTLDWLTTDVVAPIQGDITNLENTKVNISSIGVANGVAPLNGSGQIASSFLPSYVDDVIEVADFAALPITGEAGKIYVLITPYTVGNVISSQFRWTGTTYTPIISSPGTTDALAEGLVNLYYTNVRAAAAAPVQTVFGRTGTVSLLPLDISTALGYVPYSSTNPNNYITAADLAPYATTASLAAYVTNSALTATLASYVTASSLATTLGDYVTALSLATTLGSYATTAALSSYVTASSLATTLGDYVTASSLTTTLGGYVTSGALTTALGSYATTASLAGYVTTGGLTTALSSYVTGSSLATTLSGYVTSSVFSTANSWTAKQSFASTGDTATHTAPGLQATGNASNGAYIAFNRLSTYSVNMGLDSDNVFRIGGHDAPANLLQLNMTGNLTVAGNVTAFSDARLKRAWVALDENEIIKKLTTLKAGTFNRIDLEERQLGVSAQELIKIFPEAVFEDIGGMLSVAYGNAALVACVLLAKKVTSLEERLLTVSTSLGAP